MSSPKAIKVMGGSSEPLGADWEKKKHPKHFVFFGEVNFAKDDKQQTTQKEKERDVMRNSKGARITGSGKPPF